MSYFLVFYVGKLHYGLSYGSAALQVGGSFLNRKTTNDFIISETGFLDCTITNVIRLTKEEFDIWSME